MGAGVMLKLYERIRIRTKDIQLPLELLLGIFQKQLSGYSRRVNLTKSLSQGRSCPGRGERGANMYPLRYASLCPPSRVLIATPLLNFDIVA